MPVQRKDGIGLAWFMAFLAALVMSAVAGCTGSIEEDVPRAIEIVEDNLHMGPGGGTGTAVFKSEESVTASTEMDWCEVEVISDTLRVFCLPNESISERFAIVTLSDGVSKLDVAVCQDGQYSSFLEIPENVTVSSSDVKLSYPISTNVRLSASTDQPSWCRLGVSSTAVMITLSANPDMDPRYCRVTFSTDSKTVVVNVRQLGRFYLGGSQEIEFPKTGGESTCEFICVEDYVISADDEWLRYKVAGDSLKVWAEKDTVLTPRTSRLTITTSSGFSKSIDVTQKLLPEDYVGPFDFCFRSSWKDEKNKIYEYAVDAWWDSDASQIVFDLVSYVLRFDYDPSDGQLYLSPQKAYVSKSQPYDTWLGIIGTRMLEDGTPDPEFRDEDPEVTDWVNWWPEGSTFDSRYRMLFKWDPSMSVLTMTHCPDSDFPIYRGREYKDNEYVDEYGNPDYKVMDCYGFRLGLHHVFYNDMEAERIEPHHMAFNHFPYEYRIDENVAMYGPITLVRK